MPPPKTTWTDEMRERLRAAWFDTSMTMERISELIGRSPQVLRNEAGRLGLPPRSTIRPGAFARGDKPPQARPLPPGARTLPPLPSEKTSP